MTEWMNKKAYGHFCWMILCLFQTSWPNHFRRDDPSITLRMKGGFVARVLSEIRKTGGRDLLV